MPDLLNVGPGEPRLLDQLPTLLERDAERWTVAVLPAHSAVEDAEHRFEINVKNARHALEDAGAPDGDVETVAAALESLGHAAGPAVVVVAADGEVALSGSLPEEPDDLFVAHGPVPSLLAALDLERHHVAHLAVLVDREGADIVVVPRTGETTEEHFTGDVDVVHQPKAGGWSQPRFQQRARNTWDENADDAASHVAELAELIQAELIVVSGDPKAMPRLLDHLPQRWADIVVTDDGPSRKHGDDLVSLTETMVADHVARSAASVLQELRSGLAQGTAVEGPEALDVLGEGRIGRVVVSHRRDTDVKGHLGRETGVLVGTPDRFDALSEETVDAPLADLAVWGAARFGAELVVVPGGQAAPEDGVAGFRRDA